MYNEEVPKDLLKNNENKNAQEKPDPLKDGKKEEEEKIKEQSNTEINTNSPLYLLKTESLTTIQQSFKKMIEVKYPWFL